MLQGFSLRSYLLKEVAQRLGLRHVPNLGGCPAA